MHNIFKNNEPVQLFNLITTKSSNYNPRNTDKTFSSTGAIFLLIEKLLTSYLMVVSFDSAGPYLITLRILKPFSSEDIVHDRSTLQCSLI